MSEKTQPMREQNISAITDYFKSGIKVEAKCIGIELEHTLVKDDGEPVSFKDEFGQEWLLGQMASEYDDRMETSDGSLIGLVRKGESITLEPAAQVELSCGPFIGLREAKSAIDDFEKRLAGAVEDKNIDVLTPGYHPTRCAYELELIPKQRYRIMNEYLGAISMFGICMMRGSAATQIAIDYTSVEDCLRKIRLANACVPLFSLICDNTPVFEAEASPHHMMRTEIWEKCDPQRCMIVPGSASEDFTLEAYAEYILDTPAMVAVESGTEVLSDKTIGDLFADKVMEKADIEHALSVFFTDVRLKTYIEIRPADAMPPSYVLAYAALIKGLFYNEASLCALEGLFGNIDEEDIRSTKKSLMQDGYAGRVYGHAASAMADELISISASGLSDDELGYLRPLASLVAQRTTLAEIALREQSA